MLASCLSQAQRRVHWLLAGLEMAGQRKKDSPARKVREERVTVPQSSQQHDPDDHGFN